MVSLALSKGPRSSACSPRTSIRVWRRWMPTGPSASGAAVRLVSLMPLDVPAGLNTGAITLLKDAHVDQVLASARDRLSGETDVEVLQAGGDSIEDAVAQLDWLPGEIVLVGSSRLAQPRRLFLGSTAAKMLRELPVPMIVVPRTRAEGA